MNLSLLLVVTTMSFCAAAQRMNYGNFVLVPVGQTYHPRDRPAQMYQRNYPQQTQAPTVEIQQITPEWVCNNYATGEVKYFGVKDIVTSRLSSSEVEQLLKNGFTGQTTNQNANVNSVPPINPKNPFINPNQNQQGNTQTNPENVDGIGIIEPRVGAD